eukprot:GEMP01013740.1.p1 GENE.GEMP01013740.1~~GEMP01013740.1.p1  ORF type:complete len:454 (+),score=102.74 GEMP01013740.1:154-1515(+)
MVFGLRRSEAKTPVDDLRLLAREHADKVQELREYAAQFKDLPRAFDSDIYLFRFLKASHLNMKSAKKMLNAHFEYERHWEHASLSDFNVSAIKQHYPHGWHGLCKLGRPVYIECLGRLNISELFETISMERMVQYMVLDSEISMRCRYPISTLVGGKLITNSTMIFDLQGVSFSSLTDRRVHDLLGRVLKISAEHFPETSGRILVCRAPRAFSVLWFIIKPLLRAETVALVQVHSDFGPLYDWVDRDQLPVEIGGTYTGLVSDDHGPWLDEEYLSLIEKMSFDDIDRAADAGRVHEFVAEVRRTCAKPASASTGMACAEPLTPASEPTPPTKQELCAAFMDSALTNDPTVAAPSCTSSGSPDQLSSSIRADDASAESVAGSSNKWPEALAVAHPFHSCTSRMFDEHTGPSPSEAAADRVDVEVENYALLEGVVQVDDAEVYSACRGFFTCGVA